jgi:hypothetical protein
MLTPFGKGPAGIGMAKEVSKTFQRNTIRITASR